MITAKGGDENDIDERRVLWNEAGILAVDKPAGLSTRKLEAKLKDWLKNPNIKAAYTMDTETSGVVLLSKTAEARASLEKQLEGGRILKSYLAFVAPAPKEIDWKAGETDFLRLATRPDGALIQIETATEGEDGLRDLLSSAGSPAAGPLHSHRIAFEVEGPLGGERSATASVPSDFPWSI